MTLTEARAGGCKGGRKARLLGRLVSEAALLAGFLDLLLVLLVNHIESFQRPQQCFAKVRHRLNLSYGSSTAMRSGTHVAQFGDIAAKALTSSWSTASCRPSRAARTLSA